MAGLMAQVGGPAPVDVHAYTATLQIGYLVTHVISIGSPQLIAGLSPSPALSRYALTIWPAQEQLSWSPRSLAEIGGLIALARSLDAGLDVETRGAT